jgi:hypothetical protein
MAENAKKPSGHQTLLIDIGSASVGGGLLTEHKTGVPELSHVKRVPIGAGSEEGKAVLSEAMQTALATLLKEYAPLMKHGTVRVVLAAPWHHAKIRTIQASDEKKPIQVSMRSVERLVEKYKNEAPPEAGRADLEAAAVQVRVNGYPTSLTEAVEGTSVKVNLYESEVDTAVKASITEAIARELPGALASFHSFPLIMGTALRVASVENNFTFADVGGEVTDLGIIHADGIHFLASFPVGFQTIVRSMQGDAASRLALYARGELSPEETATTEAAFSSAFKPWMTACENALKEGSEQVPIPRTLFIASDNEPLSWIVKGIASLGTTHLVPTPVDASLVQRLIAVGDEGVYDVFLALSAIFFHRGVAEVVGENRLVKV